MSRRRTSAFSRRSSSVHVGFLSSTHSLTFWRAPPAIVKDEQMGVWAIQ